jgi:DNA primase
VSTVTVPRANGGTDINYALINDERTIRWAAEVGRIELYPFLHCADNLMQRTSVVFDLVSSVLMSFWWTATWESSNRLSSTTFIQERCTKSSTLAEKRTCRTAIVTSERDNHPNTMES